MASRTKLPEAFDNDQAQWDAETLKRAHEIQSHPARHKAAQAHAAKQASTYSKIAGPGRKSSGAASPPAKPTSRSKTK